jgi:hypothetical protein
MPKWADAVVPHSKGIKTRAVRNNVRSNIIFSSFKDKDKDWVWQNPHLFSAMALHQTFLVELVGVFSAWCGVRASAGKLIMHSLFPGQSQDRLEPVPLILDLHLKTLYER